MTTSTSVAELRLTWDDATIEGVIEMLDQYVRTCPDPSSAARMLQAREDIERAEIVYARSQMPEFTTVWYLAVCGDCTPTLPVPFTDPGARNQWAREHQTGTGHLMTYREETRTRTDQPEERS